MSTIASAIINRSQTAQVRRIHTAQASTLVVIDAEVDDYQILAEGVVVDAEVLILDSNQNGVEQITLALRDRPSIQTVHIVSHGSPGCLYLGNTELSLETLNHYANQLYWFTAKQLNTLQESPHPLNASIPQLLLYGCNVAVTDAGAEFLEKLHRLTGATVYASTTPVGSANQGGNWQLDATVGATADFLPQIFAQHIQNSYSGVFGLNAIGSYDTPHITDDVVVSGNYAYVADRNSGLLILDISNPTTPTLVGSYNTPDSAFAVTLAGKYAYVADGVSGLQIIDITNPANPTFVGSLDTPVSARDVTVAGDYAYVADLFSMRIINISNPASPILAGTYSPSAGVSAVSVVGNYVYITGSSSTSTGTTSKLEIVNISNPASPTLVGSYTTSGQAAKVSVVGNYAYLADGTAGLTILNISNPASPTLVGSYKTSAADDVTVVGNYAYVADTYDVKVIDISNPTTPSLVGSYNTPGYAAGIAVVGNTIYVADSDSGFQILGFNTSPTAANNTISTNEDTSYTFAADAFNFTDTDSGDTLKKVKITTLKSTGELFLDNNSNGIQNSGEAIALNQEIAVADIGKLTFKPAANANGSTYATFGFKVSDGKDFSSSAYTMTVNVTPVNDAPTAVSLQNAVSSLAENTDTSNQVKVADIAVSDDEMGNNSLSLSGADTTSFEIVNNALYLKAGTTLNAQSKNRYDVTVVVDDASVGNTPDASRAYTLNITDVNSAPTVTLQNAVSSLAENTNTSTLR